MTAGFERQLDDGGEFLVHSARTVDWDPERQNVAVNANAAETPIYDSLAGISDALIGDVQSLSRLQRTVYAGNEDMASLLEDAQGRLLALSRKVLAAAQLSTEGSDEAPTEASTAAVAQETFASGTNTADTCYEDTPRMMELPRISDGDCAGLDWIDMHPANGGMTIEADEVCGECAQKEACAAYALAHEDTEGIWGGLSEADRRKRKVAYPVRTIALKDLYFVGLTPFTPDVTLDEMLVVDPDAPSYKEARRVKRRQIVLPGDNTEEIDLEDDEFEDEEDPYIAGMAVVAGQEADEMNVVPTRDRRQVA